MGNTACCEDTGSTKGPPRRRRDVMGSSDSDSDSGSESSGSESSDSEDDASPRPAAGGRRIWLAGKSPGGPLGNALQVKIPKTVRDSPSVTSARRDTRRRREEALRLSPRDEGSSSDEESSDDGGSSTPRSSRSSRSSGGSAAPNAPRGKRRSLMGSDDDLDSMKSQLFRGSSASSGKGKRKGGKRKGKRR